VRAATFFANLRGDGKMKMKRQEENEQQESQADKP
jgi:hypothetical protein